MLIKTWPSIISAAGLQVEVMPGFESRSHGELPDVVSIVWHHDASPPGPSATADYFVGAWDTASAQIWVDTNGKWWFIGCGQAWHAGATAPGMPTNQNSVGIETDHTINEAWPDALLSSLQKGTAALFKAMAVTAGTNLFFHKQIAIPAGRKVDPDGLEINQQRALVDGLIGGIAAVTPTTIGAGAPVSASPDVFKQGVLNYLYFGQGIDKLSQLYRGDLAPVNDQQLINTVQAIVTASLRSFMSGPDGSFIAFFPDYFGIYGGENNYKLTLEDIELVDFKIDVNDDELATDVFVTGQLPDPTGVTPIAEAQWINSNGVVNIRQGSAMALILGDEFADKSNFDPDAFYARFGLRPLKAQYQSVSSHLLEYLQALTLFQRKWAAQYRTQVSFTFMPELYPGMRILIKSHNVTVFVEEVVHTGSFETGFQTTATISSPAAVNGGGIKGMAVGKV